MYNAYYVRTIYSLDVNISIALNKRIGFKNNKKTTSISLKKLRDEYIKKNKIFVFFNTLIKYHYYDNWFIKYINLINIFKLIKDVNSVKFFHRYL